MILKTCVFACLFVFVTSLGRGDLEKYGPFRLILNSGYIRCNRDRSSDLNVSLINVHFYDFSKNLNESYPIDQAAEAILSHKDFDRNKKLVLFLGGYKSTIHKRTSDQIRQAYKDYPNSYLIMPDHSAYTNNNPGNRKGYERSVTHVYHIGAAIGRMLADLQKVGVSAKNIHCIGHSLGGQMLASTGEAFFNITGEMIHRITALDPAGPCYSKSFIHEQVRLGVADYVEVYHCNSGALGSSSILGDVDFIVNKNGESQPHCKTPFIPDFLISSRAATCNHRACIDLWTASVKKPELFMAYKCDSYSSFKKEKCSFNDKTLAGSGNPGTARGIFYLSTKTYDLEQIR